MDNTGFKDTQGKPMAIAISQILRRRRGKMGGKRRLTIFFNDIGCRELLVTTHTLECTRGSTKNKLSIVMESELQGVRKRAQNEKLEVKRGA